MPLVKNMLEKAQRESRISRQDWEMVLEYATQTEELVRDGEDFHLFYLVSLLEGGKVSVEGLTHDEVLRRLSVFI